MFEYPKKIIERHLDIFGHVNNATYLELYEEARWQFIEDAGLGLSHIQTSGIGPVLLELHLTFKKELKNRDDIVITSKFVGMKNPLVMELEQTMVNQNQEIASTLNLSIGIFNLKTRKLIPPPPEWLRGCGARV